MQADKEADFTPDLRGVLSLSCYLYSRGTRGDEKGELLQVITDCPGSFRNVPEEAIAHGYTFAKDPIKNGQEYLFYIYA